MPDGKTVERAGDRRRRSDCRDRTREPAAANGDSNGARKRGTTDARADSNRRENATAH
jgi:hypothetical protein